MVKFQSSKRACVVGREKALRRERHGHQELRGAKEVITVLFAHKKGAMTWLHP
jgi:hypothetical protein